MVIKLPLPTTALKNFAPPTNAERKLWSLLHSGQLDGFKFRRQHPIPPYIADFCCIEKKLIVELDGSQRTEIDDAPRARVLESQWLEILRFWDHCVLLSAEAVAEAIWNAACEPYPHPNPSPDGRGA